jgi:hypothetical protein
MELTRRRFGKLLAAAVAAWFAGLARTARAGYRRLFPGRVRALDHAEVRKPGRWAG